MLLEVAAFATGLLLEAFVHPNNFTVWKSRLRHRVIIAVAARAPRKLQA